MGRSLGYLGTEMEGGVGEKEGWRNVVQSAGYTDLERAEGELLNLVWEIYIERNGEREKEGISRVQVIKALRGKESSVFLSDCDME